MPTTHNEQTDSLNRDSQAYWNKRATTFTRDATSDYERWLLDLLALEAGEEVLDMGCATGTLAVPLARAGHRVHGCDFAEAMLAILDERATAENLPITSHLLAWEDDWEHAGLGKHSVDVAFASRSLMSGDRARLRAQARRDFALPCSGRRARQPAPLPRPALAHLLGTLGEESAHRPRRDPRTGCHGPDPGRREDPDLPSDAFFFLRRGPRGPSSPGRPEPFTAREQRLFDAYAAQHVVREDLTGPSEVAEEHWSLTIVCPSPGRFIGWSTDGSEWA